MAYSQQVYIIKNIDIPRIKIGISQNISERIKTLQNAGGCRMELIWSSCLIYNANYIEKLLHDRFKKYRYLGEWFNINQDEVVLEAISLIAEIGEKEREKQLPRYNKPVPMQKKAPEIIQKKPTTQVKSLNINKYKRIKPGIYMDTKGIIYSIKYRMDGSGWNVSELEKID